MQYKRVLYKISGEALTGKKNFGYDVETMIKVAKDIKATVSAGFQVCLVIGGGNICRGAAMHDIGMERATGDYMGMLATVMNAIAMQSVIEREVGLETRVMSSISMKSICELYVRRKALNHFNKNRLVIFAAGVGSPFFTTDTGAILRSLEMCCDAVFKGTSVDGVYSADPKRHEDAIRYEEISHNEVLNKQLRILDPSAVALARDNNMPIVVFSIKNGDTPLHDVLSGKSQYTIIS